MISETNFPDEAFFFSAGAAIDDKTVPNPQNTCVSYGADIEAAFGGGVPAPNDQITFSRIRVRVNVPVPGTYTITHPYGVETAVATTATLAVVATGTILISASHEISGSGHRVISPARSLATSDRSCAA